MGKTTVSELAQKLGLENDELLEKLKKKGVDAKDRNSVLDDRDIQAFQSGEEPNARIEERRISTGVIRRRRKEPPKPVAVEKPAETPAEVATPISVEEKPETPAKVATVEPAVEETAPAPTVEAPPSEKKTETKAPQVKADVKSEPKPVRKPEPRPEPKAAPRAEAVAPPAKPKVEKEVQASAESTPAQPPAQGKASASRAKILGRVELPQAAPTGRRGDRGGAQRREGGGPQRREGGGPQRREGGGPQRREGGAPQRREGGAPQRREGGAPQRREGGAPHRRPAPAPSLPTAHPGEAFPAKEGRGKKGKKNKGGAYSEQDQPRRRQRREVFEPGMGDRHRKPRRGAPKPAKKTEVTVAKAIKRIIKISDAVTVGELAKRMGVKANDLIRELMSQGQMVTINHPLDFETAAILASEFNYEVENVAFDEETLLEHADVKGGEEKEGDLVTRPPVVTIMGHVDHGKTSLLDAIRASSVTEGEAGGITQHIGAYDVELDGKKISFLDTPGHEAFTAMRARGAKVTDIVILVVAADDGVMPQTKEAINHAKAAEVPIIVAINKIDKPDSNPERVKQELTEFGMVPEDWGGDTIFVEVSAKQQLNLDTLLEMVLLQAEVMELKANPDKRAKGAIVEARLDKGRGPVATVLVQEGTLQIGDPIVSGTYFGRVRTMTDDRGQKVEAAGPSCPVEVTGLSGTPGAGDTFNSVDDEKTAKDVANHRAQKLREAELAKSSKVSLDQLFAKIQEGEVKELKVIIKADVQGSVEAVKDTLVKLSTDACRLVVIHTGVGGIIESDVSLAAASDAIVLGFNVRPEPKATHLAEAEGVDIRLYSIIYDAVADIRDAMEGLLAPTLREKELGRVEIRETFTVSKVGTIAGCYVLQGKVTRGAGVRLVRDNVVIYTGNLSSLKRFKDDVKEVASGYECGMSLENYNDIKVGDIIEVFEMEEIKTSL